MNNQPQGIGGVPARLRMAREQRKLNQSELCVEAGLSRKVSFKIESHIARSPESAGNQAELGAIHIHRRLVLPCLGTGHAQCSHQ